MKKLLVIALGLLIIGCTTAPKDSFVLNGTITGTIKDSTQVFLRKPDSLRQMAEVDTALVIAGAFEFRGASEMPELHYLFFEGIRGNSPIIIENGAIEFEVQKDSLAFAQFKGTEQNDLFLAYIAEQRNLSQMAKSMSADLRQAQIDGDQPTMEALREEYSELQERARNFELDYVKNNPNSLIAALVLERIAVQQGLPLEEIEALSNAFTPMIQKTEPAKRIKKRTETAKSTEIGAKAPEFSGPTPAGDELALKDAMGKVTLIDFWAAWCKPCRMENPNIVAVYNEYKDKGLSVVGVSLDRDKQKWVDAIEADGLEWNHISHVQYFQDPIAKLYNINAIPAAFLLDENGVIIAKNLRGPELGEKISELLD